MKIVINKCFGGFSISKKCAEYMAKRGNKKAIEELKEWNQRREWIEYYKKNGEFPKDASGIEFLKIEAKYQKEPTFYGYYYDRDDKDLINAVDDLGKEASGEWASLKVVEIPDGVQWEIDDYDGLESIHEKHNCWG